MSRVRAFLLWLMVLALPLQAYAAASMALCGVALPAPPAAVAGHPAHLHDHAAHGPHGHGDADSAADHHHLHDGAKDPHADGGSLHKCGACSACHAVALSDSPRTGALHLLPQARLAEPARALATLPLRVLDKPPRA